MAGLVVTTAVSLVAAAGVVWHASYAAFSATTSNEGNTWASGSVVLGNDWSGAAVVNLSDVRPDTAASVLAPPVSGPFVASSTSAGGSFCVRVTYTGTVSADIRLRTARVESGEHGGLGQFLLFSVDTGSSAASGTDPGCAGFTSDGRYLFGSAGNSDTHLDALPGGYVGGLTGWNPAAPNTSRWYRLSWLLPTDVSDDAQVEHVEATFTWEARSL